MEVYNQIKKDIYSLLKIAIVGIFLSYIINGFFDIGIDDTDKDGFNRSGFKLLTDYGTGKQYLYRNGAIIERAKK